MTHCCERCGEKLKESSIVWLELDTRTNTYTTEEVPEEFSQGAFPFGKQCAKIEQQLYNQGN